MAKMAPHFVKKQMIQQVTESALFGNYRADQHEVELDNDETEEPVAANADRYQ